VISTKEADLLVGADGIWSAVRAQMYNEGKVKARSKEQISFCQSFVMVKFVGKIGQPA